jgi:hypothetical protein
MSTKYGISIGITPISLVSVVRSPPNPKSSINNLFVDVLKKWKLNPTGISN